MLGFSRVLHSYYAAQCVCRSSRKKKNSAVEHREKNSVEIRRINGGPAEVSSAYNEVQQSKASLHLVNLAMQVI